MSVNDLPVIDGFTPSWADITCKALATGLPVLEMGAIQAINTGVTLEVGVQRGPSGGRPMKRTTGSVDYEASLTLYYSDYLKLLRNLMASAPQRGNQRRVSLVQFQLNIQFTPPGDIEIYERRIKGCRLAGSTMNATEGTDAQLIEVPLNPIEVVDVIDGIEVVLL